MCAALFSSVLENLQLSIGATSAAAGGGGAGDQLVGSNGRKLSASAEARFLSHALRALQKLVPECSTATLSAIHLQPLVTGLMQLLAAHSGDGGGGGRGGGRGGGGKDSASEYSSSSAVSSGKCLFALNSLNNWSSLLRCAACLF